MAVNIPSRPVPYGLHRQVDDVHTFFGRRRVTRVMPGTCFKPNFAIDFLAFFSLREWMATADPAGISPPSISPASDSSEESWFSSSTCLACSSVISSMRELDMVAVVMVDEVGERRCGSGSSRCGSGGECGWWGCPTKAAKPSPRCTPPPRPLSYPAKPTSTTSASHDSHTTLWATQSSPAHALTPAR